MSVIPLRDDDDMNDDDDRDDVVKCPTCGEALRDQHRTFLASVTFIDRVCDYCGYVDIDFDGGV